MSQSPFPTQSPVSPTYNLKTSHNGRNPTLSSSVNQQPTPSSALPGDNGQAQNPLGGPFFDPSDPALFNFDLSSMNFENRYGALEFGMLGHMATGAGDSPSDSATQRGSIGRSGSAQFSTPAPGFGESPGNQPFMFGDPLLNDWSTGQASGQPHVNVGGVYGQNGMLPAHMKAEGPHAFAIESNSANFTSPGSATSPHVTTTGFEDASFNVHAKSNNLAPNGQRTLITTPSLKHQSLQVGPKRRHRNPSSIYESVKEPYGYTSGFHNLTAFIQRRFTPQKTVRIAKALASIRPSFIATTKTLNRDDLIFMEKCFQRTLWEYEDFINACGTPTIVCRRTGEIAAVGKEFSILTGWKKDVLLGKEPNLNVNTGGTTLPASGTTSRGSFTPRGSTLENVGSGRPQPVFLAELLDDDSVVEFYEDFARLAFGDSRGSVMTRCKLLKYKTKEDMEAQAEDNGKWNNHLRKGGIAGEAGMNQLGFKDGKVECAYCWTVKRDVFDIPMLIVMNVSTSYLLRWLFTNDMDAVSPMHLIFFCFLFFLSLKCSFLVDLFSFLPFHLSYPNSGLIPSLSIFFRRCFLFWYIFVFWDCMIPPAFWFRSYILSVLGPDFHWASLIFWIPRRSKDKKEDFRSGIVLLTRHNAIGLRTSTIFPV